MPTEIPLQHLLAFYDAPGRGCAARLVMFTHFASTVQDCEEGEEIDFFVNYAGNEVALEVIIECVYRPDPDDDTLEDEDAEERWEWSVKVNGEEADGGTGCRTNEEVADEVLDALYAMPYWVELAGDIHFLDEYEVPRPQARDFIVSYAGTPWLVVRDTERADALAYQCMDSTPISEKLAMVGVFEHASARRERMLTGPGLERLVAWARGHEIDGYEDMDEWLVGRGRAHWLAAPDCDEWDVNIDPRLAKRLGWDVATESPLCYQTEA